MTPSEKGDAGWTDAGASATLKGLPALAVWGLIGLLNLVILRWLWVRWKNKPEATAELQRLVAEHQAYSYDSWAELVGREKRVEFTTEAGTWYQATVEPVWDDIPHGTIRILFHLDDGGPSAFFPMTNSLLVERPATVQ